MNLSIELIRLAENLADSLTRVPQRWLCRTVAVRTVVIESDGVRRGVCAIHNEHHFGVERTLYLAKRILEPDIRKDDVNKFSSLFMSLHILLDTAMSLSNLFSFLYWRLAGVILLLDYFHWMVEQEIASANLVT